jgi:hypothetical protein
MRLTTTAKRGVMCLEGSHHLFPSSESTITNKAIAFNIATLHSKFCGILNMMLPPRILKIYLFFDRFVVSEPRVVSFSSFTHKTASGRPRWR